MTKYLSMHFQFLIGNYKDLVFTIDDDLYLEILFLRIRGETIKFSSMQKKRNNLKEKSLLQNIEHLEVTRNTNLQLLSDKKVELENIRNERLQGQIVHPRKPSTYFCNLEKKKFLEKTIKRVKKQDGHILTEQKQILTYIGTYYENLFANKDAKLDDVNLTELLKHANVKKVRDYELGDLITTSELDRF